MSGSDIAVVGGGLVGMAVAYGLQRLGRAVTVIDEGDVAFRASRGNFGLIWVQGKGLGLPDYARWTRLSAARWPEFRDLLEAESGARLELSQPGGFDFFLSEEEAQAGADALEALRASLGGDYPYEILGRNALKQRLPEIGDEVVGASFGPEDGHVNPLYLLRALTTAFLKRGGVLRQDGPVTAIEPLASGFRLVTKTGEHHASEVSLCAGLGNRDLAPQVGLKAPIHPNRGQVLICERTRPFLDHPTALVRQVGEGGVQIGDSHEDAGLDDRLRSDINAGIAARALRIFPLLRDLRVVRSWAALRIMSADGFPVYDRSESHPGASLVNCHSGVTLAAAHALVLARWIDGHQAEGDPRYLESFSAKRLDFQPAA